MDYEIQGYQVEFINPKQTSSRMKRSMHHTEEAVKHCKLLIEHGYRVKLTKIQVAVLNWE